MSSMFDSVIVRERVVDRRLGGSALLVVFLHAAALVSVMSLSRPHVDAPKKRVIDVSFPPRRAPLPLLGGEAQTTHNVVSHQRRRDVLVPPTKVTPEQPTPPREEAPSVVAGPPEGVADGDPHGKVDGKKDGVQGGIGICTGPQCGAVIGEHIVPPWDGDRMTGLKRVSGPPLDYTPEAQEHEVEGTMIVRCIIAATGRVHDCQVLRGLPFMDRAIVDALEHTTYSPALVDGQPVDVDYTFKMHFNLPQ
jgi:protein TonB